MFPFGHYCVLKSRRFAIVVPFSLESFVMVLQNFVPQILIIFLHLLFRFKIIQLKAGTMSKEQWIMRTLPIRFIPLLF